MIPYRFIIDLLGGMPIIPVASFSLPLPPVSIAGKEEIALSNICYIGDGKYDLEAIGAAGLGVCPQDAIDEVRHTADVILERNGGDGCLAEVFSLLLKCQDQTTACRNAYQYIACFSFRFHLPCKHFIK